MCAYQRWSNCLIWFATLLSPIQALQGTPALCHLACTSLKQSFTAGSPNCGGPCSAELGHCDLDQACGGAPAAHSHPGLPCECPPNCWCRLGQPQAQPARQLAVAQWPGLTWACLASSPPSHARRLSHASSQTELVLSAPEVCSLLCRFLA